MTSNSQLAVFTRQWCPYIMVLKPFKEVVLSLQTVEELKQKVTLSLQTVEELKQKVTLSLQTVEELKQKGGN